MLGARFTPEAFVFDRERKLRYHGRIDDNHGDASQVTSSDLRATLAALLAVPFWRFADRRMRSTLTA